jgi:two-component system sensor kinase FixL
VTLGLSEWRSRRKDRANDLVRIPVLLDGQQKMSFRKRKRGEKTPIIGRFAMGSTGSKEDENRELMILKHAVENTNEAFVTIDQNHKVLFFNKAAEKIFGYGREEIIGHDLNVIMSPTCSRNHREAVNRYVKTRIPGRIGHVTEMVASRKNGETFPASISFSVTEVDDQFFFTGIVRDLTKTKELQELVIQSERLAALGQMVAEITHEIKNPLMMIGGFAQQLIRETDDEKNLKKLNIITEEIRRLERLLADLKEFYQVRTVVSEAVDMRELLQKVFSLVQEDCKRHNIQKEVTLDERALTVSGDSGRLEQVFLNLVKNAIEAMDSGGKISIQSKLSGDQVEIMVTDEGCGISKQDRDKVFAPFFTTKKHGTGLGLCISKGIIEDHRGSSFSLESEEGKGTTFKIRLPLYRGSRGDIAKYSKDH